MESDIDTLLSYYDKGMTKHIRVYLNDSLLCLQFIFFWVINQRVYVVRNRRFGTKCSSHLKGLRNSSFTFSTLKMGRTIGSETALVSRP